MFVKSLTVRTILLMTVTTVNTLGFVFWLNVDAGTIAAADEPVTQNCALDTLYVGAPTRRLY